MKTDTPLTSEADLDFSNAQITVLLVDDQPFIGKMIGNMLTEEPDILFHYCKDARQAIHMANNVSPTVILQDLTMPDVDGLQMVRYYRMNSFSKQTPLIVLSGQEDAKVKADAFALGANDYIVKPPDRIELIARIRYHSQAYINMLQRDAAYRRVEEQSAELEIRNQFIKKTFGRYLSDDIVESILDTPEGLELGGEKRKVTIMMSDLRGFTSIGERLPPEDVLTIINIYLKAMTDIILEYGGTIDEFIGDAILVIFGAPVFLEDDAKRALACAIEMQQSMEMVNQKNIELGYPEVSMGIGINTGEVVVGNIGSEKRSKYGVIGSNVNLTSRIESYTVGGQILVSESTLNDCKGLLRVDDQFQVMPKGVKQPITIYDIGGIGGTYNKYLPEKKTVTLFELTEPLVIAFTILEGKHAGVEKHIGYIIQMAELELLIQSEVCAERLSNVKITLTNKDQQEITNELYGKVVEEKNNNDQPCFRVNLTSVPPEASEYLNQKLNELEN
ncbi:adenylyl cyclase [Candidatus Magnetomorum sp. HK-1]|nr:adenylyl cyclase [Candidatus Magnetomorum sp. HK-1]